MVDLTNPGVEMEKLGFKEQISNKGVQILHYSCIQTLYQEWIFIDLTIMTEVQNLKNTKKK